VALCVALGPRTVIEAPESALPRESVTVPERVPYCCVAGAATFGVAAQMGPATLSKANAQAAAA
jgi:hypothetical protein